MSDDTLIVESRTLRGKHKNRRLRESGKIPAILYGHGEEPMSLAIPATEFDALVRQGSRMVKLRGAVTQSAFIRDCQFDTWGNHVIHADLTRVSEHEKVEVEVSIELRGESPGVKEGGTLNQLIHEIGLECEAGNIPEKLEININELELHGSIKVAQLELPRGAKALEEPEQDIVQCVELAEEVEGEPEAMEAEPEVIGRAKEEEEGGEGETES